MSSVSLKRKLLILLPRHRGLVKQLLGTRRILRGTLSQVFTRCGKTNCWCAQARRGHAHARLTWSEEGTLTTRKVPAQQLEQMNELTENYRQFRSQRRKLTALEVKIQDLLDQYQKTLIAEARKPLSFLALTSKMSARNQNRQQTQPDRKNGNM